MSKNKLCHKCPAFSECTLVDTAMYLHFIAENADAIKAFMESSLGKIICGHVAGSNDCNALIGSFIGAAENGRLAANGEQFDFLRKAGMMAAPIHTYLLAMAAGAVPLLTEEMVTAFYETVTEDVVHMTVIGAVAQANETTDEILRKESIVGTLANLGGFVQ